MDTMDATQIALLTSVATAIDREGASVDTETGKIGFGTTTFSPIWVGGANLDSLRTALKAGGLLPENFDFLQLQVTAQIPTHEHGGGTTPGAFPDQLAIVEKMGRYSGIHQVDLVLKNPAVTVTEIQNGIAKKG